MKRNSKLLALMLSGTLVAGPLAYGVLPALADQTSPAATNQKSADAVAKTTSSSNDTELLTTVDDAYTAMREVRAARLALFDGNTDMATQMTNDAIAKMQSAETSEAKWGVPVEIRSARGDLCALRQLDHAGRGVHCHAGQFQGGERRQ